MALIPLQRNKTSQFLLILVVLALYLPFVNKAFNVDDPMYIWVAKHIQHDPLDFYGFFVNWYGKMSPISYTMKNPPLFSYYLAVWGALFGWSEISMHLAAIVPVVAFSLGTYRLAERFGANPFQSALATICTPVVLVSGTTVMCDIAMTAFYVWAIYFWVTGLDEPIRPWRLASAGLLVALSGLTKYFGVSLIPLLAAYALWRRDPVRRWLPFLILPVAVFGVYQWWTARLYGYGLLFDAVNYASQIREDNPLKGLIVGLAFTGGCEITFLTFAPLLLRSRGWLVSAAGVIAVGLFLLMEAPHLNLIKDYQLREHWFVMAQLTLFTVVGCGLLFASVGEFLRKRDAESLLLLLWILGTLVFASLINWSVTARNILPLAPAAGIIIVRRFELVQESHGAGYGRMFAAVLIPAMLLSLTIAFADYRWAGETRAMAVQIRQLPAFRDKKLWFQGHWGFQYYMEQLGAAAVDFRSFDPQLGEVIVTPSLSTNIETLSEESFPVLMVLQTEPCSFLTLMNENLGSGFYSNYYGPLPYAFGNVKPELYFIQMRRPQNRT